MDTVNNVLNNFNCIVDYMSKCINDKFVKVQKACKGLDPNRNYHLSFLNKDSCVIFGSNLWYDDHKWYAEFYYEDTCCSSSLPCEDYRDSITGMTTTEVANLFSMPHTALIVDITDDYEVVSEMRL